jgi:hypothetical protein
MAGRANSRVTSCSHPSCVCVRTDWTGIACSDAARLTLLDASFVASNAWLARLWVQPHDHRAAIGGIAGQPVHRLLLAICRYCESTGRAARVTMRHRLNQARDIFSLDTHLLLRLLKPIGLGPKARLNARNDVIILATLEPCHKVEAPCLAVSTGPRIILHQRPENSALMPANTRIVRSDRHRQWAAAEPCYPQQCAINRCFRDEMRA